MEELGKFNNICKQTRHFGRLSLLLLSGFHFNLNPNLSFNGVSDGSSSFFRVHFFFNFNILSSRVAIIMVLLIVVAVVNLNFPINFIMQISVLSRLFK